MPILPVPSPCCKAYSCKSGLACAAQYNTWPFIKLTPNSVLFSFLCFFHELIALAPNFCHHLRLGWLQSLSQGYAAAHTTSPCMALPPQYHSEAHAFGRPKLSAW